MFIILSAATIIITIVASTLLLDFTGGTLGWFGDFRTLLLLLILCIPILLSAGVLKDLYNGIRLTIAKQKPANIAEVKRAIQAVKLTIRVFGTAAVTLSAIVGIVILRTLSSPDALGPLVSMLLLFGVYAGGITVLLLPIESRLEFCLIELIHTSSGETVPDITADSSDNPNQANG